MPRIAQQLVNATIVFRSGPADVQHKDVRGSQKVTKRPEILAKPNARLKSRKQLADDDAAYGYGPGAIDDFPCLDMPGNHCNIRVRIEEHPVHFHIASSIRRVSAVASINSRTCSSLHVPNN